MLAAAGVWAFFAANFAALTLAGGDSPVQYGWIQRLFGDSVQPWGWSHSPHAIGYFFGLGLLEAPFYGIGKALHAVGVDAIGGHDSRVVMVALGTGV